MDLQRLTNELKDSRKRVAILEESLRAAKFEIVRLEDANSRLLSAQTASKLDAPRVGTLEAENAQLRQSCDELREKLDKAEEEHLAFREQIALLQTDNGILSKDVMELTDTINELTGFSAADAPVSVLNTNALQATVSAALAPSALAQSQGPVPIQLSQSGPAISGLGTVVPAAQGVQPVLAPNPQIQAGAKPRFVPYEQYEDVAAQLAIYQDDEANAETKTAQIIALTEKISRLESTIESLRSVQEKSNTWEENLCKAESRITELEVLLSEAESFKRKYDELTQRYSSMEKENLKYQAISELAGDKAREAEEARVSLAQVTADLDGTSLRLAGAEEQIRTLQEELSRLRNTELAAEDAVLRIRELEEQQSKLVDEYTKSMTTVSSLKEVEDEARALRLEVESQKAKLLIADDQMSKIVEENERLQRLKDDQAAEVSKLYEAKRLYEYMKERFEPIKIEIERLRAKERNYAHIFATVDATNMRNDQRYQELEQSRREEIKRRDETITNLKDEKLRLNEEIINLKANLHLREEEFRRASARVSALEASLASVSGSAINAGFEEELRASQPASIRLSGMRGQPQMHSRSAV
ncbi:putative Spindle pole protein [Giardia duodenalis]|uniref:Spindle pole protein n=1 Tax=Giardia intestinalis (strain ATCC 50803 / WB clone C6) TaxID=184922 RepID=A8BED1_GIAIC|nr:putative Spindle pole protein [Giardia intestinalis]KAE8305793.1 putative Spindle pole protein [Giardia intestinalis]|eukprot:XP_001707643.1 Spindle pole protein, putative [Giardia lamblia ATCC 50803]